MVMWNREWRPTPMPGKGLNFTGAWWPPWRPVEVANPFRSESAKWKVLSKLRGKVPGRLGKLYWDAQIHPKQEAQELSGPNRAMQPRCAMRFESHTPKSLAMRKSFSLAMRKYISLIWNHRKMPEKPSANILRCWPAMQKIGMFFTIERCEMPAIRTPAAVWSAMQVPAMPNR